MAAFGSAGRDRCRCPGRRITIAGVTTTTTDMPPRFAGTPGKSNCFGQSVATLAGQYHGLNTAAAALGYSDANTLENAILAFCGG